MPYDLLVAGSVVLPDRILADGWVAISGEIIAAVGSGPRPQALRTHDAGSAFVLPGLIDGQTHAGSRFGFAGLEQTTRSAVAGGITTIVDMPYDEPNPVSTAEVLEEKAAAANAVAYGDVALYATITKEPVLSEVDALVKAGAVAFKISSYENHPTRFPRITNEHALDLLEALADTDLPVGLHNEDQEIVKSRLRRFEASGETGGEFHSPSRPPVAELVSTASFLELGAATGAHVHIVHISTPRGFELVRRYQEEGFRATAEMCIHYLHFDAEPDMRRLGALLKVNPPIRPGVREALWDEFALGGIDFVSSDHSAWPLDTRQNPSIFKVTAGIPGLETLAPALFSGFVARGYDAALETARYLSERPARFFGLWPRKGSLLPGFDADITVLDPAAFVFDAAKGHDGLGWSPFSGETLNGRPAATFVRGVEVWNGKDIVGRPGHGRYLPRLPK